MQFGKHFRKFYQGSGEGKEEDGRMTADNKDDEKTYLLVKDLQMWFENLKMKTRSD